MANITITTDGQTVFGDRLPAGDVVTTQLAFSGSASVFAREGDDYVELVSNDAPVGGALIGDLVAYGQSGDDTLIAVGGETQNLRGGDGNDSIVAVDIRGERGSATVDGGAGDDVILNSGSATTYINAGTGDDLVELADAAHIGDVSTEAHVNTGSGDDTVLFYDAFADAADVNLELTTGDGDDLAAGTLRGAWFRMGEGNDTVDLQLTGTENDGNSRVDLGAGDDYLIVRGSVTGNDEGVLSYGGSGEDTMLGGTGDDTLAGNAGADEIAGRGGDDKLLGGNENDTLDGGAGDDYVNGGNDDDLLFGRSGDDNMRGGSGDDTILTGAGDDYATGNDGDDGMRGAAGDDILTGGAGQDTLCGEAGDDILIGNSGNDDVYGGQGDDLVRGGTGDDRLLGANGDDTIFGGGDRDFLNGGAGNNILDGGTGDDVLFASQGVNEMTGGEGSDLFRVRAADEDQDDAFNGQHTITDFDTANDTLSLRHVADDEVLEFVFGAGDGNDLLIQGVGDSGDNYVLIEDQDEDDAYWDAFI